MMMGYDLQMMPIMLILSGVPEAQIKMEPRSSGDGSSVPSGLDKRGGTIYKI